MTDVIRYALDEGVAQVTLNRPSKYNALSFELFDALIDTAERIKADPGVRVVVLHGAGDNFCAGLDIANFQAERALSNLSARSHGNTNLYQQAAWAWREVPVPVIAAVAGVCFGGGLQIASGADMRYVHPEAKLSILEIKWGLVPDMAGTQLWSRFVREDILRELTYTGRVFSGQQALEYGFATRREENPLAEALNTAKEIAARSPDAIRANKQLINQQLSVDTDAGLLAESVIQDKVIGKPNQIESVMANFEKRSPIFIDPTE